ncbi:acyltransferase family protein [Microbacterium suaedae]|uniref:acyltransferase family protein n=1 Tax=Microbacterium suaedae TaxID=2067813 RepID=UPI0013A60995|nr:acyltransferase family protein [Microbacterium suaedae]
MAWADVARALCVLGVVLMHTVITVQAFGFAIEPWRWFVDAMGPFRMSALSMISGLLLSRRIRAGWADEGVRVSVALSAWLYATWLLLFTLFALTVGAFLWVGPLASGDALGTWQAFARQLVLPRTVLWYVLALAVWTAVLATLRRVSPAIVLVALAALSATSFWMPVLEGSDQYRNICRYAFFFALGVYGARFVRDALARHAAGVFTAALGAFALLQSVVVITGIASIENLLSVPRDAAGALVVLSGALFLAAVPLLGRALAWIGRRTLPIYVTHALLLETLILFPGWWVPLVQHHAFARAISPLIITLGCAAAAIAVHALVMRTPMRVIFALPGPIRRRLTRA